MEIVCELRSLKLYTSSWKRFQCLSLSAGTLLTDAVAKIPFIEKVSPCTVFSLYQVEKLKKLKMHMIIKISLCMINVLTTLISFCKRLVSSLVFISLFVLVCRSGLVLGLTNHAQCGCGFKSSTVRKKNSRETPGSHDLGVARPP